MAAPVAQPTVSIRWRPCPRANRVQLPAVLGRTNELCVCRCSHDGDGWDRVQGLTVITQRRVCMSHVGIENCAFSVKVITATKRSLSPEDPLELQDSNHYTDDAGLTETLQAVPPLS